LVPWRGRLCAEYESERERERSFLTINKTLKVGKYDALSGMSHVRILCKVPVVWGAIRGFVPDVLGWVA
jgi:hypothetical protein